MTFYIPSQDLTGDNGSRHCGAVLLGFLADRRASINVLVLVLCGDAAQLVCLAARRLDDDVPCRCPIS